MGYSYASASRKRADSQTPGPETAPVRPSLDALRAGTATPTREQMGRRVDLPDAMRSKMETAFGTDLSAVKLYESETVAQAGANAVTRGSDIAFAPGMLDFTSFGGQALLGHEISHVVSQQRGEATGGGFLNDRALEARADREGAMAAAGRSVAMPAGPLSSAGTGSAAGPMQASKTDKRIARHMKKSMGLSRKMDTVEYDSDDFNKLSSKMAKEREKILRLSKGTQTAYWGMHLPNFAEREQAERERMG